MFPPLGCCFPLLTFVPLASLKCLIVTVTNQNVSFLTQKQATCAVFVTLYLINHHRIFLLRGDKKTLGCIQSKWFSTFTEKMEAEIVLCIVCPRHIRGSLTLAIKQSWPIAAFSVHTLKIFLTVFSAAWG